MPKPRLGQHFLADARYLKPILEAAVLAPEDAVIEVGPGKGMLTRALLDRGVSVLALEVDERLANGLHERLGHRPGLDVRLQDARRVDWTALCDEVRARGHDRVKLVANLPYYLATQMVVHALAAPRSCERLVVMVQEEVARRMCAAPGGRDFSAYSVAVQYYGEPRLVVKVPPKAFQPPPRVSSAVAAILRRDRPAVQVADPDRFFYLVHAMFTHRRKTLRNCLQGIPGTPPLMMWERSLADAGLDGRRRPETLSLSELGRLFAVVDAPTRG